MKYLDLREVPNEIVIAIYNTYGEKRNGHACEGEHIRYFKDEYKKLFSPSVPSDIAKTKERIANNFKDYYYTKQEEETINYYKNLSSL